MIDAYVSKNNLECNKLYYEDLINCPDFFFKNLPKTIPELDSIKFTTELNRQSNSINHEWKIKYKEDIYALIQHNKLGPFEFIQSN
jgi:hypothetical protein